MLVHVSSDGEVAQLTCWPDDAPDMSEDSAEIHYIDSRYNDVMLNFLGVGA